MNNNNSKGFTLIELVLALGLISLVIGVSFGLITFSSRAQKITVDEYEIQTSIRRTAEEISNTIRYSKAVFSVPETFISSVDKMDPGWDYLMVTNDGKKVVRMEYDETLGKHKETVIVPEKSNIRYELVFEKEEAAEADAVLEYKIKTYIVDTSGNVKSLGMDLENKVEAINTMQVVDRGTVASPSIALAYRSDGKTEGQGKNQIAYVTIVVDVSGSMNQSPSGDGDSRYEHWNARIKHVRSALAGSNTSDGIISQFGEEENVFLSLVPFSTTANYPNPTEYTDGVGRHQIYEPFDSTDEESLIDIANDFIASGGTNTGDGLRQAYYLHQDFRSRMNDEKGIIIKDTDQVHHYMIMLVDGETTYEAKLGTFNDEGYYPHRRDYREDDIWIGGNEYIYDHYNWRTDWKWTPSTSYFTDSGNIDDSAPEDEELSSLEEKLDRSRRRGRWEDWSIYYWYEYYYNVYHGSKNASVSNIPRVTGNGSSIISNSGYVTAIGNLIKSSQDPIKSFIIGYSSDLETHIEKIGLDIGTESDRIYAYNDTNFDLEEIFRNIANEIMADFWLLTGPQIMD
jgi:prepilin-type N-terminal cleavage/methylation domain-containing protein